MADTSNCCGGPRGKHVPGCDSGRQNQKFKASQQRVNDSEKRAAEEYVRKYGNFRFDTKYQPGSHGVPAGVHMERRPDGGYRVVLD
jgi:hypothetical protein